MTRLLSTLVRSLSCALIVLACASALACAKVTTVSPDMAITIQARPPAPPLPGLPPVDQPPPPPRVTLEGELVTLDEALSFDAEGQLAKQEHADILAELAAWMAEHDEVLVLSVEVSSIGEGSRRAHKKRSQALATQIVEALVEQGVAAERLVAAAVGESEDGQRQVTLRVSERAQAEAAGEDGGESK